MNSNGLSPKQRQILAFISRYWFEHCYPPTIREIVDGCGLSSTSVAAYNLERLRRAGHLAITAGRARSIVPTWVAERMRT